MGWLCEFSSSWSGFKGGERRRRIPRRDERKLTSRPVLSALLDVLRCALIHHHRPELLDYDALDKVSRLPLISPTSQPRSSSLRSLLSLPVRTRTKHRARFPDSSGTSRYPCALKFLLTSWCQTSLTALHYISPSSDFSTCRISATLDLQTNEVS